jgi:hypothetical protein
MNVECPDCHGTGRVHFMQSPRAPEVLCNRCGGAKVIKYVDAPTQHARTRLVPCECYRGATSLGVECPKCKGEGARNVPLEYA